MKYIGYSLIFFCSLFKGLIATDTTNFDIGIKRFLYTISECSKFNGDKQGDFKEDTVAILSDGSGWKIHPKDYAKFTYWIPNEIVSIRVRPNDYWFKREHKFFIYNHMRRQVVRVMLVNYPNDPLIVTQIEKNKKNTDILLSNGIVCKINNTKTPADIALESPTVLVRNSKTNYYLLFGLFKEAEYFHIHEIKLPLNR